MGCYMKYLWKTFFKQDTPTKKEPPLQPQEPQEPQEPTHLTTQYRIVFTVPGKGEGRSVTHAFKIQLVLPYSYWGYYRVTGGVTLDWGIHENAEETNTEDFWENLCCNLVRNKNQMRDDSYTIFLHDDDAHRYELEIRFEPYTNTFALIRVRLNGSDETVLDFHVVDVKTGIHATVMDT